MRVLAIGLLLVSTSPGCAPDAGGDVARLDPALTTHGAPCQLGPRQPRFCVELVTPSRLPPGVPFELAVVPLERAENWSYAWSDGQPPAQAGELAAGAWGVERYLPATCAALRELQPFGSERDPTVTLTLTVRDAHRHAAASASLPVRIACAPPTELTTETLYAAQERLSAYEEPPPGFAPVFTELVARHGARGLSSAGDDLAGYALWQAAQAEGALTPLGQELGPDLLTFSRANTILGAGVAGITTPGYGNLSHLGAQEHQALAGRLWRRLHRYFAGLPASGRQIVVETSGVNRAYDSAGYFVGGLDEEQPALAPLVVYPAAPTSYGTKPKPQLPGTNRFQLYFHKLTAAQDLPKDASDPNNAVYQASLAYQRWKASDPLQTAKVAAVAALPAAEAAAQAILARLFAPGFVAKLGTSGYIFRDTGSFTFTGADGKSYTTTGSGGTSIASALDAANALFSVYAIVPAMQSELGGMDFAKYIPDREAAVLAFQGDATDYYQMGPGAAESGDATYAMARGLVGDFFRQVDAIAAGNLATAAKLRFTHAEIVVPFTSALQLPNIFAQLPAAESYTHAPDSPWNGELTAPTPSAWRDEIVAPMAANVQWDVVRNAHGRLLVKMLLNEKEIDFKRACDGARFAPGSHYYDFAELEACYGQTP